MILTTGPAQSSKFYKSYSPDEFESEALSVINNEKTQWDEMPVNVAKNVQYLMRNVVDQSRRYYAGIFENPNDEVTGDKKTWVPLTETAVESVIKSIDLDTKDVLISPGTPSAINFTPVIRATILNLFKKINFGQLLNNFTATVARDGTVVVKNYIAIDPNTKKKYIKSSIVDFMNFWVDPTANSLQESPCIERSILTKQEVDAYKDVWNNLDNVAYSNQIERLHDVFNVSSSSIPQTEIWERWGEIPKSWLTKKIKDKDTLVQGHIVASGTGSPQVIHLIRSNPRKDGKKPYEEAWYRRINGRWPGRGIPEMLFGLQEYTNEIVNTRRTNNRVLQNGIFLIRKGSGISPDMLSAITAGGGLPVTNINNDIRQLNVQDFRQSSYTDEDRVQIMADRVTGAFDINRGEVGLASASATATLTRDRNIRDTFILIQENIGFFIERLIRNHYIPLLREIMTEDDFIKVTGDADFLATIDEQIINNRKNKFIKDTISKTAFYPEQLDLDNFVSKQISELKKMGKQRFIKYFRNIFDEDVDIEIHITDEKFNRVVAVQQLRDMLIAYSNTQVGSKLDADSIFREMLNIMGVKGEFFLEKPQIPAHAIANKPRPLKDLPTELPNEVTAFENASRVLDTNPPVPGQLPIQGGGQIIQ